MAKLFASETAEAVARGALQRLGGYGELEEFDLARIYRDVRVRQVYEGASDIRRLVIAQLPRYSDRVEPVFLSSWATATTTWSSMVAVTAQADQGPSSGAR